MRVFSLIVVGFALIALTIVLLHNRSRGDDAGLAPGSNGDIPITGAGNTLAAVCQRLGRPAVFEYNPKPGRPPATPA